MKNNYLTGLGSTLLVSSLIAGCGTRDESILDHSQLNNLEANDSRLVKATSEQTELLVKNGLFVSRFQTNYSQDSDVMAAESADDSAGSSSGNFSTTTVAEQGVAESDRVKYDGNTMFIASNNDYGNYYESDSAQSISMPHVRILQRQNDDSLVEQAVITTSANAYDFSDLYLHNNTLVSIYSQYDNNYQSGSDADLAADWGWYYPDMFALKFNNVTDTSSPTDLATYSVDGYIKNTRRIENMIYIVSTYYPEIDDSLIDSNSDGQALYEDILDIELENILPNVQINGGDAQLLVQPDQCYLPADIEDTDAFSEITTVTSIDINDPENFQSICVIAPAQGLYASTNNLYLHNTIYDDNSYFSNTVVHQFAYDDSSVSYQATGKVSGELGWNNPHLRFSEQNDYLRVVTTQNDWTNTTTTREHKLFVLQNDGQGTLAPVAQLPNDEYPSAIGNPNEDI